MSSNDAQMCCVIHLNEFCGYNGVDMEVESSAKHNKTVSQSSVDVIKKIMK